MDKIYKVHHVKVEGVAKQTVAISQNRLLLIAILFLFTFSAIIFRIVDLGFRHEPSGNSFRQITGGDSQEGRANIYDRNGILLATSLKTPSLYANPKRIIDAEDAALKLLQIFPNLNYSKLYKNLSSKRGFVWVKRFIHPKEKLEVNNLGIPGLEFEEEYKRTYPHGNLISHLIGMVGTDGHGLSGVEKEFDAKIIGEKGEDLYLSLDLRVQNVLHNELLKKYEEHSAKGAAGIIMDVRNGEILAMVSLPDFDPNMPSSIKQSNTFNNATKAVYEMGSTFKAFTVASALDSGTANMKSVYDARKSIKIARFRINDFHAKNKIMSLPEVLVHSSNIGTARIAEEMGTEIQKEYFERFGMFDRSYLEIPELATPILPSNWGRITTMTTSYGHGIAVSPVHVVRGVAALVNGGVLKQSTILKNGSGESLNERVISKATSDKLRKLLRLVVTDGSGKKADAKGYFVGGKTGTAEKISGKKYDRKSLVSSFVSAFPMNDPKYVVFTLLDEPKGIKKTFNYATAGWTAAPVVGAVISKIGPILGVQPVDMASEKLQKEFYIDYEIKDKALAHSF